MWHRTASKRRRVAGLKHQFKEPEDGYHAYNMAKVVTSRVAETAAAEAKRVLLKKDDKGSSPSTTPWKKGLVYMFILICKWHDLYLTGWKRKKRKGEKRGGKNITLHKYIDIRTNMYGHTFDTCLYGTESCRNRYCSQETWRTHTIGHKVCPRVKLYVIYHIRTHTHTHTNTHVHQISSLSFFLTRDRRIKWCNGPCACIDLNWVSPRVQFHFNQSVWLCNINSLSLSKPVCQAWQVNCQANLQCTLKTLWWLVWVL